VARLVAWLQVSLERNYERATDFDEPSRLWPMVGDLCHVEEQLIPLVSFAPA